MTVNGPKTKTAKRSALQQGAQDVSSTGSSSSLHLSVLETQRYSISLDANWRTVE